jgi:hypothetical protein
MDISQSLPATKQEEICKSGGRRSALPVWIKASDALAQQRVNRHDEYS